MFLGELSGNQAWIGGALSGGRWQWISSGAEFIYTNWLSSGPGNKPCVSMKQNEGQWFDEDCDNSYRFVCQFPLVQVSSQQANEPPPTLPPFDIFA